MSKLRFIGENLVDETGNAYEVSLEELIKACDDSNYTTLSVASTICEKVSQVTGCEIDCFNCRRSSLFALLEKAVVNNEAYKQKRKESIETFARRREYCRNAYLSKKPGHIPYCDQKAKKLYRLPRRKISYD